MQLNNNIGWVILISVCFSTLSILLLHVLQPELIPTVNAISEYVHGSQGWLMTSTFFILSTGSFAIGILVIKMKPKKTKTIIVGVLFLFAAVGSVIAGLFPTDPISQDSLTPTGQIHAWGGIIRFISLAAALPLLSSVIKKKERWKKHGRVLTYLSVFFVISFIGTMFILAPLNLFGLGQRIFIITSLVWMAILSLSLIQVDSSF